MLFEQIENSSLYAALTKRDSSFDGHVFVGVSSTGIFCRLSCPARTPKKENCKFLFSVSACVDEGYRACKRCHPMGSIAETDASIRALLDALEDNPSRRWTEGDIVRMGLDPSTVRRAFKRHFGITFLDMARTRRLQSAFTVLSDNGSVTSAQIAAGFESPAAFRAAFAKLLGMSPSKLVGSKLLVADWIETKLGPMICVADRRSVHLLEFLDRKGLPAELNKLMKMSNDGIGIGKNDVTAALRRELSEYFESRLINFKTPVTLHGTTFQKEVWRELQEIPMGTTRSYSEFGNILEPRCSARAVASANGANQIAILVPCHRLVGTDGSLTGYGGGLWRKHSLIETEKRTIN